MKRYRRRYTKPGVLEAYYGRSEDGDIDVCFAWGAGVSKCDAHLLNNVMADKRCRPAWVTDKEWDTPFPHVYQPSFLDELEARGYDLTTLKFTIRKKGQQDVQTT